MIINLGIIVLSKLFIQFPDTPKYHNIYIYIYTNIHHLLALPHRMLVFFKHFHRLKSGHPPGDFCFFARLVHLWRRIPQQTGVDVHRRHHAEGRVQLGLQHLLEEPRDPRPAMEPQRNALLKHMGKLWEMTGKSWPSLIELILVGKCLEPLLFATTSLE